MSAINQRIMENANVLAYQLQNSSQSVANLEEGLQRTARRVVGAICGLLSPLGVLPGVFVLDASADFQKLNSLNSLIQNLETVKLDESSKDVNKAKIAQEFQKSIYTNIANYTRTAQTIKMTCFAAESVSVFAMLSSGMRVVVDPETGLPSTEGGNPAAHAVIMCAGLVSLVACIAAIANRYVDRPKMEQTNREQAFHYLRTISVA